MKKIHRVVALLLSALMVIGLMTTAFAATDSAPTIDPGKKASLSIYKYDITKAGNDGAWDAESYVSTGLHDDAVIDKLSKYAIQGVEFTYLRVADIAMNNELVESQRQVGVLYGFDGSDRSNAVLSAIGLTAADAHKTEGDVNYFTSDMLNNKLSAALAANATTVKNALEAAVKNGGVAMTETDATGHASADQMEQGLYLVVETRVPENVTSTCNPFFVSLPMTTTDGAAWNYDVTVYPKNQTGNPTLDKTVREAKNSTGKNTGSLTDIGDGYAHTATASVGDTVDYQIISTLPTITSKATSLSEYTYVDTLSKGTKYNKNDVVIEFFKDSGCTDKITTWAEDSGKFTVTYQAGSLYTRELLQEVLLGLHSLCMGADAPFFNGHTNITGDRFLVFGVGGMLTAAKSLRNALLFNVLAYMSDRLLTAGNTVAALDELYLWLSNPVAIEYIRNCLKRVRKRDSALLMASQNLEDFDQEGVREMTKPLFAIPPHQFLFNPGSIGRRFYMDMLQLDEAEFELIRHARRGECLFKCGAERYLLEVKAPPHKAALFGTAGGR